MTTTLYMTEYVDLPFISGVHADIVKEPNNAEQVLVTTGASATFTNPLGANTNIIRLHYSDTAAATGCSFKYDGTATPVATTSMHRIANNQTEYFYIDALKRGGKLAAITN